MRLLAGVLASALAFGSGVAVAQESKTVRGTVAEVGADSVTVKVKDQDMKFGVDKQTVVTARGGSTAERKAQTEGRSGPALGTLVKVGQTVEVKYSEAGMHASSVRVLPGISAAPAGEKPMAAKPESSTAAGTVTAMTGTSLTLKSSAGETTFALDDNTKVIGAGLGTKARESAAAGKKQTIADVVAVGDTVSVTWHDIAGAKHASTVRVREKAARK